jgi:hypothetical protein
VICLGQTGDGDAGRQRRDRKKAQGKVKSAAITQAAAPKSISGGSARNVMKGFDLAGMARRVRAKRD